MLGFVTPVGAKAADPLCDVTSADAFWRLLPRNDPLAAQQAVCGALADLDAQGRPTLNRLKAVLVLDQRARNLIDGLLIHFVAAYTLPSLEKRYWQAAFELCRAFGQVHGHFLRMMRDSLLCRGWREYLPQVVTRITQHRQIELLLQPFVDDPGTGHSWVGLHEAFQFAHSLGLSQKVVPITRCHTQTGEETTLEREYIHVLLQGLINEGQFPPHDAFWVSQNVPRWCTGARMETQRIRGEPARFVVDLERDGGLARSLPESPGARLYLDTAPILDSVREQIAALRDAPKTAGGRSSSLHGRQLKLLRKLEVICAPKPPVIARRGERKPIALTVEVIAGLSQILRALRGRPQEAAAPAPAVPEVEEITITAFGGFTETTPGGAWDGASTIAPRPPGAGPETYPVMKLVNRSDSGCRLDGQMFATIRVTPGSLIAFREDAALPWSLAVVRRVERLNGKRVNIGVEYVGNDPRGVIVSVVAHAGGGQDGHNDNERHRIAGIYLSESKRYPLLPIKTLVLPAHKFAPDDRLTLRTAGAVYTIHLKDALEEQGEFVWAPFEIVERQQTEDAPHDGVADGA